MKIDIISIDGKESGKIDLPKQFEEEFRPDIIRRAVWAVQSTRRQPYGAFSEAGKRPSAKLSKKRKDYKGSYGHGISRVPRKIMSRRGTRMNWIAAFAPGTVGGRKAHPPKAEKIWMQKINKKERRKAIRSALSASLNHNLVVERGHLAPKNYPFIIESNAENISRTKDFVKMMNSLELKNEIERVAERKVRAGKGKMRNRKYRTKKGPIIVVSQKCPLLNASKNIPGIESVEVRKLNAELLAPGAKAGRLALFTEKAIQEIAKSNLFR
ncbi:MAG TPA: 50S ribosomal protein L4 [Candidatus Nanoarchaeia archaeon]|nr:50S ribosomal protein L4 [Candidatus Nanoarchaeia archaeon]